MRQTHSAAEAAAEPQERQETAVEAVLENRAKIPTTDEGPKTNTTETDDEGPEINTTKTEKDPETDAMRDWDRMAFPNTIAPT